MRKISKFPAVLTAVTALAFAGTALAQEPHLPRYEPFSPLFQNTFEPSETWEQRDGRHRLEGRVRELEGAAAYAPAASSHPADEFWTYLGEAATPPTSSLNGLAAMRVHKERAEALAAGE